MLFRAALFGEDSRSDHDSAWRLFCAAEHISGLAGSLVDSPVLCSQRFWEGRLIDGLLALQAEKAAHGTVPPQDGTLAPPHSSSSWSRLLELTLTEDDVLTVVVAMAYRMADAHVPGGVVKRVASKACRLTGLSASATAGVVDAVAAHLAAVESHHPPPVSPHLDAPEHAPFPGTPGHQGGTLDSLDPEDVVSPDLAEVAVLRDEQDEGIMDHMHSLYAGTYEFLQHAIETIVNVGALLGAEQYSRALGLFRRKIGRKLFAWLLNQLRSGAEGTCMKDEACFNQLAQLVSSALEECARSSDIRSAVILTTMTATYSLDLGDGTQRFLIRRIRQPQQLWGSMRFWEEAFFDKVEGEFSQVRKGSHFATHAHMWLEPGVVAEEAVRAEQNIVFSQLGSFAFTMLNVGQSVAATKRFIQRMALLTCLGEDLLAVITESLPQFEAQAKLECSPIIHLAQAKADSLAQAEPPRAPSPPVLELTASFFTPSRSDYLTSNISLGVVLPRRGGGASSLPAAAASGPSLLSGPSPSSAAGSVPTVIVPDSPMGLVASHENPFIQVHTLMDEADGRDASPAVRARGLSEDYSSEPELSDPEPGSATHPSAQPPQEAQDSQQRPRVPTAPAEQGEDPDLSAASSPQQQDPSPTLPSTSSSASLASSSQQQQQQQAGARYGMIGRTLSSGGRDSVSSSAPSAEQRETDAFMDLSDSLILALLRPDQAAVPAQELSRARSAFRLPHGRQAFAAALERHAPPAAGGSPAHPQLGQLVLEVLNEAGVWAEYQLSKRILDSSITLGLIPALTDCSTWSDMEFWGEALSAELTPQVARDQDALLAVLDRLAVLMTSMGVSWERAQPFVKKACETNSVPTGRTKTFLRNVETKVKKR